MDITTNMSGKREFCFAQLFGVILFCFGFVGGILIGIYVYHGGPDSEVNCKNLPEPMNNAGQTDKTFQTASVAKMTTDKPDNNSCPDCYMGNFTYTINNQLREPFFNNSVVLTIVGKGTPLIDYMEKAVDNENSLFSRFKATYFSQLGYFIESINNVSATYAVDKSYWEIRTSSGPTSVGVSSFIPTDGMKVLINLTVSTPSDHN